MNNTTLDKKSRLPLYYQLKLAIEEQINSGEWPPDTLLPSERELCAEFKVSRITVRQALAELVTENRLIRSQGRGTFVAHPQIQQPLKLLTGFTEDMQRRGKRSFTEVLQLETMQAPRAAARALGLAVEDAVILLKRLRFADAEPMALETAYLPGKRFSGLTDENLQGSLYTLLKDKFRTIPRRAEQEMRAIACPSAEAKLLRVRKGSPVLHIYRTTYGQDEEPIEWVESFYRGDQYVFCAEMRND